ncbi:hypothetical protein [Halobacillus sp. HZG1]|uniref:hypothetical protein n=1 Tax=Halobacillus sp. HZG1 TaxID=3111769 RepID=UPI002DBC1A69|nr:hypothetical protein [Halobacillus sp. HZG1]
MISFVNNLLNYFNSIETVPDEEEQKNPAPAFNSAGTGFRFRGTTLVIDNQVYQLECL